jgi:putative flippase GtrA
MREIFRRVEKLSEEIIMVSRFTIIGICCSIIHIGTAIFIKELHNFSNILSSNIGFFASFTFSFFGHYKYSFSAKGPYGNYFPKFCIMSIFSFCLSMSVVWIGTDLLACDDIPVFLSLAIIIPVFNFLASRFWVFTPDRSNAPKGQ